MPPTVHDGKLWEETKMHDLLQHLPLKEWKIEG